MFLKVPVGAVDRLPDPVQVRLRFDLSLPGGAGLRACLQDDDQRHESDDDRSAFEYQAGD